MRINLNRFGLKLKLYHYQPLILGDAGSFKGHSGKRPLALNYEMAELKNKRDLEALIAETEKNRAQILEISKKVKILSDSIQSFHDKEEQKKSRLSKDKKREDKNGTPTDSLKYSRADTYTGANGHVPLNLIKPSE